jgi:methylenetetrahydrofolate reductase (NADPH)
MQILVHNDFHQAHGLFPIFDDLEVEDLDRPVEAEKSNGTSEANGIENIPFTNGSAERQ